MAQEKIKKIIGQLKEMKESKQLTINEIVDALDRTNNHLAPNTVTKFFADGSEEMGFQYETIRAIADVLLNVYSEDAQDDEEVKGLKSTVQLQNILIDQLKEQLREEQEHSASKLRAERDATNKRIEFLRERIRVQDHRIDQKDRMIAIMMIALLKHFDPELIAGFGIEPYFGGKMSGLSKYLNGEDDAFPAE